MKILKFSATWCAPCQMLAKTFEGIEFPFEVKAIDIDEDQTTPAKYGVRGVPTVVLVEEDGSVVKRFSGYKNEKQIKEWLTQ